MGRQSSAQNIEFFQSDLYRNRGICIEPPFLLRSKKECPDRRCIDVIKGGSPAGLIVPRHCMFTEYDALDFIRRHDPVLGPCPHVRDTIEIVRFADSLQHRDNDQVFSPFFNDADIRCDLRFYPGGDLLGESAELVVGRIYADYCPGVGPAKRDDAAMMVEEPAHGFERRLDEGEGFFEFQSVGFVEGHDRMALELCTELRFSSFFLLSGVYSAIFNPSFKIPQTDW